MTEIAGEAGRNVTIMSALAVLTVVNSRVLPEFEKDGWRASLVWDPTVALMKRIAAGETADGIVAIEWALDELASRGRIDPSTRRKIARTVVGVAVRPGAPKPDISTADALRDTLLAVPSLVYSRAGASGIFFEKLIDQLGIGDAVRAKSVVIPAGLTGEVLARGEVELAIQQISELMAVDGIDIVGPMPPELQATTDFGAAVFSDAASPEGARRFIAALQTPEARLEYKQTGLEPLFT